MEDCIFCRIAEGTTPADVVYRGEGTVFFRDVSPKARVHLLAIPEQHIASLSDLQETDEALLGRIIREIPVVAEREGLAEGGYRLICNVGSDAGQAVRHLHFHILGGESLGPLRC